MKPLSPPNVPGKTEHERMDNALRHVFTVSKDEILKKEAKDKKAKGAMKVQRSNKK